MSAARPAPARTKAPPNQRLASRFNHHPDQRIALPDGSVKYLQTVGQPDRTESGRLAFVGTVMDITERKRAEEALRNAQAELVRVARLTTMGQLVASIAHFGRSSVTGFNCSKCC